MATIRRLAAGVSVISWRLTIIGPDNTGKSTAIKSDAKSVASQESMVAVVSVLVTQPSDGIDEAMAHFDTMRGLQNEALSIAASIQSASTDHLCSAMYRELNSSVASSKGLQFSRSAAMEELPFFA